TVFRYEVHGPAVVDRATYTLSTLAESTLNTGLDTVATIRRAPFSLTGTYTYVRSQEGVGADRGDIPLTPRQRWNRRHVGEGAARCRSGRSSTLGNRFASRALTHTKSHQSSSDQRLPATT